MNKLLLSLVLLLSVSGVRAGRYGDIFISEAKAKQVKSGDLAVKIAALVDILAALDAGEENPGSLAGLGAGLNPDDLAAFNSIRNPDEVSPFLKQRYSAYLADALTESSDE